jgi:hypothetical protein
VEGACLQQADVSALSVKVFDLGINKNNPAGVEVTPAPTIAVATNIFDTLRTIGWPTSEDSDGYNFRLDIPAAYTAKPGTGNSGNWYAVEIKITLTGGTVAWLAGEIETVPVQTS